MVPGYYFISLGYAWTSIHHTQVSRCITCYGNGQREDYRFLVNIYHSPWFWFWGCRSCNVNSLARPLLASGQCHQKWRQVSRLHQTSYIESHASMHTLNLSSTISCVLDVIATVPLTQTQTHTQLLTHTTYITL